MMEIGIYEKIVPDDLVEQELAEMSKMIEEVINLANETSDPKKALAVFLRKLDIDNVIEKLPFDFLEKEKRVKVQMDFTCIKTSETNPVNLIKTAKNLLSKKEETDNCCDEGLKRIATSMEKMIMLSYRTTRPSSVLLSFNEHLRDINMILPLALNRLGILK